MDTSAVNLIIAEIFFSTKMPEPLHRKPPRALTSRILNASAVLDFNKPSGKRRAFGPVLVKVAIPPAIPTKCESLAGRVFSLL